MQSLDRMMTFVKVVERNSYIAVANQLKLSRAAISKQITILEEELGIKLIHRTTRRLKLTEAGEIYYNQCKKILGLVNETNQLISHMREEPMGLLKVVSGRYFAERYILPFLDEFMTLYPKITINLELAERIPDPYQEEIDIVVGMSIPGPPDVIQRTIGKTRYVFCASPNYLNQYGIPKKPLDLTHHRYITHIMRRPDHVLSFSDGTQLHVEPIVRLNDAKAMIECALKGLGVIKIHDYIVKTFLEEGELVEFLQDYNQKEYSLYLYYAQSRNLSPKIRSFIDFLLTKL